MGTTAQGNLLRSYLRILSGFRRYDLEAFAEQHERLYREAEEKGDYAEPATHYYSVMADFLEAYYGQGWVFVPPERQGQPREEATRSLYRRIARLSGLAPGRRALDIGCGMGDAMREVALESGGAITGITIGPNEVDLANARNEEAGLADLCQATQGDYNALPFDAESFDTAYAIYSYKYSVSLKQVFSEVRRVLKPGGLFLIYDMIRTPTYDANNPEHVRLLSTFAYSTGMPPIHCNRDRRDEAIRAGFDCLGELDLSQQLPWYYYFERPSLLMRLLEAEWTEGLVTRATHAGLMPAGFDRFYREFVADTITSMVNAGRKGILSGSNLLILARR